MFLRTLDDFISEYEEYDPDELIDMLGISSKEILERFDDKIETFLLKENEQLDTEEYEEDYGESY